MIHPTLAGNERPCTCPSGDGSLRWPCPQHPGAAAGQLVDAMIDTETLGTRPGSAILSIGAVMFGLDGLGATFYAPISLASCVDAGLTICPGTVAWWMRQSDAARAAAFPADAAPLPQVLLDFSSWFVGQHAKCPWSHGATFDIPLLEAAYQACGITAPWKFWDARDTRTLYDLASVKADRAQGTHHNALDDAKAQAEAAVKALAVLRARRGAPAMTVKTWRERIAVGADFPLHAPTDVERAMEAEIAELRTLLALRVMQARSCTQDKSENAS